MSLSAPTSPAQPWILDNSSVFENLNTSNERFFRISQQISTKRLCPIRLQKKIAESNIAIEQGWNPPKLLEDCTGGTYLIREAHGSARGIFKPSDEEPFSPNNPKGYITQMGRKSMREGIQPGTSSVREVAAYLLDRADGWSSVPQATMVESAHPVFHLPEASMFKDDIGVYPLSRRAVSHGPQIKQKPMVVKTGSFQEYIEHEETASDVCVSHFPVSEVHKIALLDIRTWNLDRNDNNILVCDRSLASSDGRRRNRVHSVDHFGTPTKWSPLVGSPPASPHAPPFSAEVDLIPIDHAYILPKMTIPHVMIYDWCWMTWPQAKVRFSPESVEYIMSLDPIASAKMLREELTDLPPECGLVLISGTVILQCGAEVGKTLLEIGLSMVREVEDQPSICEHLIQKALHDMESEGRPWGTWGAGGSAEYEICEQMYIERFQSYVKAMFVGLSPAVYQFVNEPDDRKYLEEFPVFSKNAGGDFDVDGHTWNGVAVPAQGEIMHDQFTDTTLPYSPKDLPYLDSESYEQIKAATMDAYEMSSPKTAAPSQRDPNPNPDTQSVTAQSFVKYKLPQPPASPKPNPKGKSAATESGLSHSHSCHSCVSSLAAMNPSDVNKF